jgi:hypothetical protein
MSQHIILNRRKTWCRRIRGLKYKKVKGHSVPVDFDLSDQPIWMDERDDGSFMSLSYMEGIYLACTDSPRYGFVFAKEDVCWQLPAPQADWLWRIEDYQRKHCLASSAAAWEKLWYTLQAMYENGTPASMEKDALFNTNLKIHWTNHAQGEEPGLTNVAEL